MAGDLGGLECAAGTWLSRLRRDEKLPTKSTLEALRRREQAARKRAEKESDLERRYAAMCQDRLEDERRLHAERLDAAQEARLALKTERQLRVDAEVKLAAAEKERKHAEQALADEAARRQGAELLLQKYGAEITDLRALIADDQSLRALDEFSVKLEAQRNEIETLRRQLESERDASTNTKASLDRASREHCVASMDWDRERLQLLSEREELARERDRLIVERDAALADYTQLHEAGVALQAAAEAALRSTADADARHVAELEHIADMQAGLEEDAQLQAWMAVHGQLEAFQSAMANDPHHSLDAARALQYWGTTNYTEQLDDHGFQSIGFAGASHTSDDTGTILPDSFPEQDLHHSLIVEPYTHSRNAISHSVQAA